MTPPLDDLSGKTLRGVRRLVTGLPMPTPAAVKRSSLRLLATVMDPRQERPPFFSALHDLLSQDGDVSLQELMDSAGEQTYGLMVLVSGLTSFIPGISMAGGLVALVLGWEMLMGRPHPWLPSRIGRVKLHRGRVKDALARFEGWLNKLGRPKRPGRPLSRKAMGAVIAWTAFLLALPVPPLIPLGNALPAAAVCLQGAALLEERPGWAWLGVLGMFLTTVYLGLSFQVILHYLLKLWH